MSPIRTATTDDVPPLATLLARAFADDPFIQWILDSASIAPASLELLYGKLVSLNLAHGRVFTDETRSSAAVWRPAHRWKASAGEELSMLAATLRTIGGARFVRLLPHFLAVQKRHPKGPFAQLVVLGVDPAVQGRGLGSRLMRTALDDCDASVDAAYLETSQERNLPLYERYGFRVTDVFPIPKGPKVWFMWRDPRRT